MRGAQDAQAFEEHRRVLEQHVVAEVALLGRHDDPRRARQCVIETGRPAVAARRDAGANEILAIEREQAERGNL